MMSEVKILLCDDDPDLLGLLDRRLKKLGIEPDAASDGREAKSLVDANSYDVIVTDIYMPEATGLDVMQYAKQKDAETQVVIITSSATLDNAIDALNHGAFGYLTKPFDHLIVFDNMVSRALEYRQLIVADKRRAEAQKRRGDMLEDEVAQRVMQLQKNQKGLLDLLGSLPDGILIVEQGGKVVLSSPVGERWLAQDQNTEDQPIHAFINQVHAEIPEPSADVTVNGVDLHLISADFRDDGEVKRKAVIIREVEEDSAGAGSLVTETVMGIRKGLATLYEQGLGTEVVLNVASQFAVLEQLQGWSTGTGELKAAPALGQAPVDVQTPDLTDQETAVPVQTPTGAGEVTSAPPFAIPRERTPTGELDGPRLNTSELQDALRAAAPDAQPADVPAQSEAPAPAEAPVEEVTHTAPVEAPAPSPPSEVETSSEPDTQSTGAAAPTAIDETPAPAREDPELPSTEGDPTPEPEAFPRVDADTADVPSWIDGIEGRTDPDLLSDFEFESEQPEPTFPKAQTGEILEDDSMFKARVIPEEVNAKLKTPVELPNANGDQEYAPPQHDGPITIQASQADTQVFRKVLEGLSGTNVLSGDYEKSAEEPPSDNGDAVAEADEGLDELRAEFAEAPASDVPDVPVEAPQVPPAAEELRPVEEPDPGPQPVKANWPPSLPTEEDEWDDELDVSG
ncbi:MAG: response regulator [Anaerolineales bacterium]